jgi:quercetin dioxygenase-like cupin family protein
MEQSAVPATDKAQLMRSGQCDWTQLEEPDVSGISVKVLRFDTASQRAPTILLKFEPGASYPAHDHPGGEEVFVLEGEVTFGRHRLEASDYLYMPPGEKHAVWSRTGCVVLLSVPEEVIILKQAASQSPACS